MTQFSLTESTQRSSSPFFRVTRLTNRGSNNTCLLTNYFRTNVFYSIIILWCLGPHSGVCVTWVSRFFEQTNTKLPKTKLINIQNRPVDAKIGLWLSSIRRWEEFITVLQFNANEADVDWRLWLAVAGRLKLAESGADWVVQSWTGEYRNTVHNTKENQITTQVYKTHQRQEKSWPWHNRVMRSRWEDRVHVPQSLIGGWASGVQVDCTSVDD